MKLSLLIAFCIAGWTGTAFGTNSHFLNIEPVVFPGAEIKIEPRAVSPGTIVTLSYSNPALTPNQRVFAHYGFNGWNLEFAGSARDYPMGNLSHYKRSQMTWNSSFLPSTNRYLSGNYRPICGLFRIVAAGL